MTTAMGLVLEEHCNRVNDLVGPKDPFGKHEDLSVLAPKLQRDPHVFLNQAELEAFFTPEQRN
jgi:hypothetical protein